MTAKTMNYTEAQVTEMTQAYTTNPTPDTVKTLAADFGKTVNSVRAKLSNLGVYKPQARTTKAGAPIVRKETLVAAISAFVGKDVGSFVKANKTDLEAVVAMIAAVQVEVDAFNEQVAEVDAQEPTAEQEAVS